MKKSSVVTSYLAYMSGSITIDNTKIVDELLNKLVAQQILASGATLDKDAEFSNLMSSISNWMTSSEDLKKWFKVDNNLIAFCAAAKKQAGTIGTSTTDDIEKDILIVDHTFKAYDPSRIKLQTVRRKICYLYFSMFSVNRNLSPLDFLQKVMQEIE